MKLLNLTVLVFVLLFMSICGVSQGKNSWISDSLRRKGLDGKFELSSYISPSYLQADLNGDGSDDFGWANKWSVFNGKKVKETLFDKKSGDIIGGRTVILKRPCILLAAEEDGAVVSGGLIYWNGTKYIWIHQGE